jgi:hypothetical protein
MGRWFTGNKRGWEAGKLGGWEAEKLGSWEAGKLGGWEAGKLGCVGPGAEAFEVGSWNAEGGKERRWEGEMVRR